MATQTKAKAKKTPEQIEAEKAKRENAKLRRNELITKIGESAVILVMMRHSRQMVSYAKGVSQPWAQLITQGTEQIDEFLSENETKAQKTFADSLEAFQKEFKK